MEQRPVDFFQELKVLITDYVAARFKLLKYEVYEKTAKIAASLFSSLVIVLLVSLLIFFLSIALGFYLGALFNSNGSGFMVVSGLYLIVLVPFVIFRKSWIEKQIVNKLIGELTEKEEEEI